MKIVVIGGTGLIGKQLAPKLRDKGHEVVQASPSTGVNALTGEGLGSAFVTDPSAGYFGTPVDDRSLVPLGKARLAPTHYDQWLRQPKA